MIDFITVTTIVGPPTIDEEELSDDDCNDSEDDDLADLIDDTENMPPTPERPLSPPSSPLPSIANPSDSEDDNLLYSSNLPTSSIGSIFAPLNLSINLSFKDKGLFSPKLSSSRNNSLAATPSNLACSTCIKQSDYSNLLGLDETDFQCDSCLLADSHPGCGEKCDKCKEIAAVLEARWIHREMQETREIGSVVERMRDADLERDLMVDSCKDSDGLAYRCKDGDSYS